MRSALVAALSDCADGPFRVKVRRYLQGLSADELQFIAAFWGACVLEADGPANDRADLARRMSQIQSQSTPNYDGDHKMILLMEYLGRTGAVSAARVQA